MERGYDAAQRAELRRALDAGEPPVCPACGTAMAERAVEPARAVSYVRRRVLLICPGCRRSASLDRP